MSSRPLFKVQPIAGPNRAGVPVYEVVLSFADEDRAYVQEVASFLESQGVDLFYDGNEEADLWGKDLVEHLEFVYRRAARFCVMFISSHYAAKVWPSYERKSALARAIQERAEYILPARFDSTDVSGLLPTIGYVDLSTKSPRELGLLILKKLGRSMQTE